MGNSTVSKLSICNSALMKIGEPPIPSIPEEDVPGDKAAHACKVRIDPVMDEVISAYPWTFALRSRALTPVSVPDRVYPEAPLLSSPTGEIPSVGPEDTRWKDWIWAGHAFTKDLPGPVYSYLLPWEVLFLARISDKQDEPLEPHTYQIEGREVRCEEPERIYITYTRQMRDRPSRISEPCAEAMAWRLVMDIGPYLGRVELREARESYYLALKTARSQDVRNSRYQYYGNQDHSSWIEARG